MVGRCERLESSPCGPLHLRPGNKARGANSSLHVTPKNWLAAARSASLCVRVPARAAQSPRGPPRTSAPNPLQPPPPSSPPLPQPGRGATCSRLSPPERRGLLPNTPRPGPRFPAPAAGHHPHARGFHAELQPTTHPSGPGSPSGPLT